MDDMKLYMAPMEGMTGYIFRNVYERHFGHVDRYFTPFFSGNAMGAKELRDSAPENNKGMDVVPQILANHAESFLTIAGQLYEQGYREVNLNLGCPSGTVVSKGRGAGFLKEPEQLEHFLDEIFEKCPMQISVKTRIGMAEESEWERLQEIYNRFPMTELIIHPRLRSDLYRGPVHYEIFREAIYRSRMSICFNGDIRSASNLQHVRQQFPGVDRFMIGRGLFRNPGIFGEIRGEEPARPRQIRDMMAELLEAYREDMKNDTPALFKMKEIWVYLGESIPGGESFLKKIKKSKTLSEYRVAVSQAFSYWEGVMSVGDAT